MNREDSFLSWALWVWKVLGLDSCWFKYFRALLWMLIISGYVPFLLCIHLLAVFFLSTKWSTGWGDDQIFWEMFLIITPCTYTSFLFAFCPQPHMIYLEQVLTEHSFRNYDKIRALHKGSFNTVITSFYLFLFFFNVCEKNRLKSQHCKAESNASYVNISI